MNVNSMILPVSIISVDVCVGMVFKMFFYMYLHYLFFNKLFSMCYYFFYYFVL